MQHSLISFPKGSCCITQALLLTLELRVLSFYFNCLIEMLHVTRCAGFAWDRVNFLCSDGMELCFGFVLNSEVFSLLLSRAYTDQGRLCFVFFQQGCWEHMETQLGQVTQADQRYIPDHVTICSVYEGGGRGRKVDGDVWGDDVCLPSPYL